MVITNTEMPLYSVLNQMTVVLKYTRRNSSIPVSQSPLLLWLPLLFLRRSQNYWQERALYNRKFLHHALIIPEFSWQREDSSHLHFAVRLVITQLSLLNASVLLFKCLYKYLVPNCLTMCGHLGAHSFVSD